MRPYSVMRMFEFLVVAVIEVMVGDSFNPHFTESMTLRSFPSICMSFPSENMTFFANAGPTDGHTKPSCRDARTHLKRIGHYVKTEEGI